MKHKSVVFIPFIFLFFSCSRSIKGPETQVCLGTVCSINLYESGSRALYSQIFARLQEIENKFSVNIPESQISQINQNAGIKPVSVDEEVYFVLKTAKDFSKYTDGAFDVTVGPLVKLWGINTKDAKIPSEEELKNALEKIDWQKLRLDEDFTSDKVLYTAFLEEKEMSLDSGGIAKGYACDKVVEILQKNKVSRAVVDLGGNIFVYGKKPDEKDWIVGVKNPFNTESVPVFGVKIKQGTVVTSGNYERFFTEDGKSYHHILSTENGFPIENGVVSVTIIADKSILGDALSTSLFVLGKEKGFELLETLKKEGKLDSDISAVFIEQNGTITASENLKNKIVITDSSKKVVYTENQKHN